MKHLKLFFALFAMLALGVGNAWAETVFSETFGAGTTSNTAYSSFTKYSATKEMFTDGKDVKTHYSGDGKVGKNNLSEANLSSGYDGASGGSGCYHGGTANTQATIISISNINIQDYTDLTLSFGALGGSTTHKIDVTYSIDGGAEKTLISSGSITTKNWTLLSANIAESGASLTLYFKHKPTKTWTVRLDDFKITGTLSSETPDEPTCTTITPTLTYSATSLFQDGTATATLEGNTGNGEVTYTTSDNKIATVDANGTVTAVGAGSATITATIAAADEYCDGTATAKITVTPLISCAEVYDLADDATFALKEFVVTYANGKYTYIKDGTGYGLIFNNAGAYGLKAGDQVAAAELAGKKDTYNGLVEIIPTSVFADLEIISGTAPDPEVMNALPVKADMNKYVKFEDVTFASTTFSSKKVTGKINAGNITFYDQFATNATFNTSKKYDVIGAVSIYNSTIQVNFISAEEVAEPTLNVKITDADFGKIAINGKAERTLTLNGSLLTQPISLAIEGEGAEHFTLDSESVTPTDDGNITDAKIKITYEPIAEGTHTATLKITSDELAEQTITLQGQAVQQHTVHFFVNGEEQNELAKKVLSGNTLEEIPTATSCDLLNYPTFAGWTSAAIDGTTDVKPTMLDLSTTITSDCKYYAVFAKGTTSTGTANTSYELVLLPSHFTTSYNERSFTATANEVDGEGTLEVSLTSAGVMKSTDASKGNPIQFRKKSSSTSPGTIYNTTDLGQINSISYADGTNNIASTIIGASQQPTEQEDGKGFFMITNGTNVSYIPSITINFTKTSVSEITTYEYITSCAVVVPTCEITYDYADGEGECTNDIVEEGAEYTLCATAPTKAGHTFLNWKDQHGTEYAAGATITSVTEDLTLTAQWQVNSYEVTWMSLGDEVLVNSANYNTQPTKPTTAPSYTCGIGSKEFVGWTTQEIDGVGVPANLYTDEFPVVTKAITYHAVFASINSSAESTTHTLTPNNSWSGYAEGTITDNKGYTWSYCAAGTKTDGVYSLNLRNKDTETSYIGSPLFTANVKGIKATIVNGSASKARKVYVCSAPTLEPTTGDLGITEVAGGHSGELSLTFEGTISQFYLQVSDALQFQSIVVEVGADPYTDYTTSCPVLELTEGENTLTNGVTADVKVNRSFEKDKLYTISLPFALNNVSDIFGNVAYEYSSLAKNGDDVVLYFSKVNTMEAGKPYLIEPTKDVHGFTVENVTLSNTTNNISFFVDATAVSMEAVLSASASATTEGKYWLASDKYLYNNSTTLKSLRALFTISTPSGIAPRVRVALEENGETGLENITDGKNTAIKVIENGQLVIIRDGEKFNAQGQRF